MVGAATYTVENGMMVGTTVVGSPNSFLVTEKEYGDFILEADIELEDSSANTGVQFSSHYDAQGNDGKGKVYGYQYELDPSARQWSGGIYDEGRRDWLYPMALHPEAQNAFQLGHLIQCI